MMTHAEITSTLSIPASDRTDAQTKELRSALRGIARSLSRDARRLLARVGVVQKAAVRVAGTDTFRISTNDDPGKSRITSHSDAELRDLLRAGAVTVTRITDGIGTLESTRIGLVLSLHY